MKRCGIVLAVGIGLAVACGGWLATCRSPLICMPAAQGERWPATLASATLILLAALMTAWLARVLWILAASVRAVRRVRRLAIPPSLSLAAARAQADRIECIADDFPIAICCGGFRPALLISAELVQQLSPDELVAVLVHEDHHARRLDPLRRAMLEATADILFWLPLIGWWTDRCREESELLADQAAISRAGRAALAGALWKVGSSVEAKGAAAFGGAADLRVAQLLGDTLPRRPLPVALWMGSAAGMFFALNSAWCIAHIFGRV